MPDLRLPSQAQSVIAHWLVGEGTQECEEVVQRRHTAAPRPAVEPDNSWWQVRRPSRSATTPRRHRGRIKILIH